MGVIVEKKITLECDICKSHTLIEKENYVDNIQLNGGKYVVCTDCYNKVRNLIIKLENESIEEVNND
jgi:hypothetical protein